LDQNANSRVDPSTVSQILERSLTQSGESIIDILSTDPVLLVFLRHAGCSFCREALSDISSVRFSIESRGTRIILVYMGDEEEMEQLVNRYGLAGVDRICDPDQLLYEAFGLKRGTFAQLFGTKVLRRAFLDGVLLRHGIGRARADASQLPGAFLLDRFLLVRSFRHRTAADRPDYEALCTPDV
jgi:peroxiredoxin